MWTVVELDLCTCQGDCFNNFSLRLLTWDLFCCDGCLGDVYCAHYSHCRIRHHVFCSIAVHSLRYGVNTLYIV